MQIPLIALIAVANAAPLIKLLSGNKNSDTVDVDAIVGLVGSSTNTIGGDGGGKGKNGGGDNGGGGGDNGGGDGGNGGGGKGVILKYLIYN